VAHQDLDDIKIDSLHALGRIPTDSEEGRARLEQSFTGWINQLDNGKWPRGLQWFENASYLCGNHLTRYFYSADGGFGFHTFGIHDKSPYDNLVAKVADNKLIRPTENVAAMLTQSRPEPRVDPNSESVIDEDAAALSEIVIRLLWERPLDMPRLEREAATIGAICGTAICEVEYGDTSTPVEVPEMVNVEEVDAFTGTTVKRSVDSGRKTTVMRKDIKARMWTPYHITPDPAATSPSELTWIARATWEDIDWIKDNFDKPDDSRYFPENLDSIGPENTSRSILFWWTKIQDIIDSPQYYQHGAGMTTASFQTQGGYAPNQVVLRVVDVKPTKEFVRGRTLIFAAQKLIYAGDARCFVPDKEDKSKWRYPNRWHPYAFWGWMKVPGKFWHVALLSQLVPLQKKINSIDALVHANRQFMSLGQWLIPKHSKIPEGKFSGIPGEHYTYTDVPGMSKPEKVGHVPLPQELIQERKDLEQSIEYISASGTIEGGVAPSAARAGVMLDFLREQRLRSKSPMIQEYEQFLETIASNILIEIQAGLTEEDEELTGRIIKASRDLSMSQIQGFVGESLRDHHSVKIDIASELLRSPEAKRALAMEYLQYSANNQHLTPGEREGVLKATGLDEFVSNEEHESVLRARRLLSRILTVARMDLTVEKIGSLIMVGVDDAASMAPVFQKALLSDRVYDWTEEQFSAVWALFEQYSQLAAKEAERQFQLQLARTTQMTEAETPPPSE
jgi:hypothetical protein